MHYAKKLRVAVVGGGIGGLATAGFLHRAGLDVTVYEQAAMLTEVGAGLVVAPNAARLLRSLGVMDRFRGLLVDRHRQAGAVQEAGRGQPSDPSAHDRDTQIPGELHPGS